MQEIRRHVLAYASEAGCPAKHADLVIIAPAVDVGARLDQHPDHFEVGDRGGQVKRRGVVGEVADIDIGAALEQQANAGMTVSARGLVQRRLLLEISAAGVDQVGVSVEQSAKLFDAALIGGVENGAERLLHLRRTGRAALHVARQNLDRFVPVGLGDLVNGAAVDIGRTGVEAGRERAADGFDVARVGRLEHAFAVGLRRIAVVHMRLELAPAGEAVFARQRQLDGGELGLRVLLAQRLETLLGLVLEMLEARAFRQRSGATRRRTRIVCHKNLPSICARRPRISGRKSGYVRS